MLKWRCILAILAISLASACGIKQAFGDSDAKISVFHADLDDERFDEIWKETSPMFRKSGSEKEFQQLLAAVHRKLGKVQSSKQNNWRMNTTPQGTFVMVARDTKFEKGSAQESFTYVREGEELLLAGYNINSAALIIN